MRTRFVGVLGWPLDHTLSPTIHNAAFRHLDLDWIYLSFPVPPEELRAAVAGLKALGAPGANVTMPHKEAILPLLDDLSEEVRQVGAVNTVARVGERLVGHNTDVGGFQDFIRNDVGFDAGGKRALVLGAGGAARAVVAALTQLQVAQVFVAARDRERAEALRSVAMGGDLDLVAWDEADAIAGGTDLVVNATPLGMHGEEVIEGARFSPGQLVVDLIYEPPSTPLVERARGVGADAWGGLGMLVHQAGRAFRVWTGHEPPLERMSAAAIRTLGARRADFRTSGSTRPRHLSKDD